MKWLALSLRPRGCALAAPALFLMLTGCGQTGPLRLPENAPSRENYLLKRHAAAAPAAATPAANPVPPSAAPVPETSGPTSPTP